MGTYKRNMYIEYENMKGNNYAGAQPTWYKGHHMRSRLELSWAVWFEEIGVKWEYEPALVESSINYIPDFYLPEHKLWIECKSPAAWRAKKDRDITVKKIQLLMKERPEENVILLHEQPYYQENYIEFSKVIPEGYKIEGGITQFFDDIHRLRASKFVKSKFKALKDRAIEESKYQELKEQYAQERADCPIRANQQFSQAATEIWKDFGWQQWWTMKEWCEANKVDYSEYKVSRKDDSSLRLTSRRYTKTGFFRKADDDCFDWNEENYIKLQEYHSSLEKWQKILETLPYKVINTPPITKKKIDGELASLYHFPNNIHIELHIRSTI